MNWPDTNTQVMLRSMSMGSTLGFSKFFEPNERFVEWMKDNVGRKIIYDVGAGRDTSLPFCGIRR